MKKSKKMKRQVSFLGYAVVLKGNKIGTRGTCRWQFPVVTRLQDFDDVVPKKERKVIRIKITIL